MKPILETLADFSASLCFEEIPKTALHQAQRCLFDFMGCFFGGVGVATNRELLALALRTNPTPEATVWGTGRKAGMAETALAHGCLGHHLEYDDGISLGGHWGSETIPAILAVAETLGCGGPEVLSAIVVAYEVGNRVSRAFSGRMLTRGVHFPCATGVFGAAAGVAKIMGLRPDQIAGALGNACLTPMAPYGPALSGAPVKDVYAGWPNALGINAVRLSCAGWGGPWDLLEGKHGLADVLGEGVSVSELRERILKDLGSTFEITKTYFKPYPCCRWLHAPVRAVLDLKEEGKWRGEEIKSIEICGPRFLGLYDKESGFEKEIAARFSLPYVTAAAALYGAVNLEVFDEVRRKDPALAALARKVCLSVDSGLDRAFPGQFRIRARVRVKGGEWVERESGLPWGPEDPATDGELEDKFRYLVRRTLQPGDVDLWVELFSDGISKDREMERFFGLLSGPF